MAPNIAQTWTSAPKARPEASRNPPGSHLGSFWTPPGGSFATPPGAQLRPHEGPPRNHGEQRSSATQATRAHRATTEKRSSATQATRAHRATTGKTQQRDAGHEGPPRNRDAGHEGPPRNHGKTQQRDAGHEGPPRNHGDKRSSATQTTRAPTALPRKTRSSATQATRANRATTKKRSSATQATRAHRATTGKTQQRDAGHEAPPRKRRLRGQKLQPNHGSKALSKTLFEITLQKVCRDRCSPEAHKDMSHKLCWLGGRFGGASPPGDPATEPLGSAWLWSEAT